MNKKKNQLLSPENYIRTRARNLPLGTCYINDSWRDTGSAMIIVTRDHINGNITHGNYIIDLFCLGVKESNWIFNQNPLDFKDFLDHQLNTNDLGFKMIAISYVRVHNIIYGAVEYAGELGFSPHKSFELTKHILEEDDEHVKLIDIEFGFKGKPLYISTPENPGEKNRVLAHLDKKIGRDNYNFIMEAEADDFFDREDKDDSNKIDYHDPVVKKDLISRFFAESKIPKRSISKKMDKIAELMQVAEIIFFEYMVTEEELNKAMGTIVQLFDFNISDEIFSDDLLFGNAAIRENIDEVRRMAERLIELLTNDKIAEGLEESDRYINEYSDVPVFLYLKLLLLEMKSDKRLALSNYRYYADKYPEYLPFAYKYAMANLIDHGEDKPDPISESLHLKNFYPGKTTFCRHEVLLYTQLLTTNYGLSGETAMVEMLFQYMAVHHPGIISDYEVFVAKFTKIPKVIGWCEDWLRGQE
ncbi:MAG: hypothetical protein D4R64_03910 [Porphyromonadaceae bacterium]|nr:MAG: hypothetical protein D4R64_03910 [Porphyromonadaceae bacterium]